MMPFGLCNAPSSSKGMSTIFVNMLEDIMKVFMDHFFLKGSSFDSCLTHLENTLMQCPETNLVLNWEMCHIMV